MFAGFERDDALPRVACSLRGWRDGCVFRRQSRRHDDRAKVPRVGWQAHTQSEFSGFEIAHGEFASGVQGTGADAEQLSNHLATGWFRLVTRSSNDRFDNL